MYEHLTAYRHGDGTVEGFKGVGPTKAKADAVEQMKRKADILGDRKEDNSTFDNDRVVPVLSGLTPEEVETVRKDWKCGVRY